MFWRMEGDLSFDAEDTLNAGTRASPWSFNGHGLRIRRTAAMQRKLGSSLSLLADELSIQENVSVISESCREENSEATTDAGGDTTGKTTIPKDEVGSAQKGMLKNKEQAMPMWIILLLVSIFSLAS